MIDTTYQAGDVVATLLRLRAKEDARTIGEMIADDNYEVVVVTEVEAGDDGWFFITTGAGFSTGVKGAEPKVGDTVRLYSSSFDRHGWALNGTLIEWLTPWERCAKRIQWLACHDRRQRANFAEQRATLDATYDALPAPLKLRIDRLRHASPAFRITSEAYELAAVGDAPKIARAIAAQRGWPLSDDLLVTDAGVSTDQIAEAVKSFHDLGFGQQQAMVPGLNEGHSGNTFGATVSLALRLLTGEVATYEAERAAERTGSAASRGGS